MSLGPPVTFESNTDSLQAAQYTWGADEYFMYIVATWTYNTVTLYWQLKPGKDLSGATFTIYRSNLNDDQYTTLATVSDTWYYEDRNPPISGTVLSIHYKIKITKGDFNHESGPVYVFGNLNTRQKLLAKAILRRLLFCPRHWHTFEGVLLKRRYNGVRCACVDSITKEILNSDCTTCFGTGIQGGYWQPPSKVAMITRTPLSLTPTLDTNLNMGTVAPQPIRFQTPANIPINKHDVWVHLISNRRFYINEVQVAAEVEGLPLLYVVEARPADLKDVIYRKEIV